MAKKYDYDIGIIGGGAAGLTVAAGSAQLGAKTILIEKEADLGGDCLHYGCVPSKTLIRTAQVYHQMKNASKFGLPEVPVQPVEFRHVARRISDVIARIQQHDSEERFCRLGVLVRHGEPTFVDEHAVRLDDQTISARYWVIATGSSPFIPPVDGLAHASYLTNRELFSLDRLPRSLVILGGGPIGIEMAQAFVRLGSEVHVVQRGDQILGKEDKDMADLVKGVLEAEGVRFHMNSSVIAVKDRKPDKEVVIEETGGESLSLQTEAVLVATGRRPNVEGLGLDAIGVEFSGRGIKVDDRLRTTVHKHIFAAGDVNGAYLFTHVAGYEGSIVVSNAVFRLPRKAHYALMPWCTYTSPELASIGMNERRARNAGVDYKVYKEYFRDNDRSLAEGEEVGLVKMILNEKDKPIGVQILGPHAGELVSEWVAILAGKVKLSTLAGAVHPYPTLGEINKRVVGDFFSAKIFSERVKKALSFLFHFKGRACRLND